MNNYVFTSFVIFYELTDLKKILELPFFNLDQNMHMLVVE